MDKNSNGPGGRREGGTIDPIECMQSGPPRIHELEEPFEILTVFYYTLQKWLHITNQVLRRCLRIALSVPSDLSRAGFRQAVRSHERGEDVPILLDSGVRRGTDVLKALALGASPVLISEPSWRVFSTRARAYICVPTLHRKHLE